MSEAFLLTVALFCKDHIVVERMVMLEPVAEKTCLKAADAFKMKPEWLKKPIPKDCERGTLCIDVLWTDKPR